MLEVESIREESKLTIYVKGKLDSNEVNTFIEKTQKVLDADVKECILDFKDVSDVTSAGLRIILTIQRIMTKQGDFKIINCNSNVMRIFDMVGFPVFIPIEAQK